MVQSMHKAFKIYFINVTYMTKDHGLQYPAQQQRGYFPLKRHKWVNFFSNSDCTNIKITTTNFTKITLKGNTCLQAEPSLEIQAGSCRDTGLIWGHVSFFVCLDINLQLLRCALAIRQGLLHTLFLSLLFSKPITKQHIEYIYTVSITGR